MQPTGNADILYKVVVILILYSLEIKTKPLLPKLVDFIKDLTQQSKATLCL